jgi:hypothetical protein
MQDRLQAAQDTWLSLCQLLRIEGQLHQVQSNQRSTIPKTGSNEGHRCWVDAMTAVIKRQKWFRWHDAGDVQSLEHLNNIYKICEATPETRHWLPTREAWIKNELDRKPANLVIRFSPPMMGQRVDTWPNSSMVVDSGASCPAPNQGGKCGDCRQCWDPAVKVVSYGKH